LAAVPKGQSIGPERVWPLNPPYTGGLKPVAHAYVDDRDWFQFGRPIDWEYIYSVIVYRLYRKQLVDLNAETGRLIIAGMEMGVVGKHQFTNAEHRNHENAIIKPAVRPKAPKAWLNA
jgi:hypothetical protein